MSLWELIICFTVLASFSEYLGTRKTADANGKRVELKETGNMDKNGERIPVEFLALLPHEAERLKWIVETYVNENPHDNVDLRLLNRLKDIHRNKNPLRQKK